MPNSFWFSERQFARLQPLLPTKVQGVPRVDDRRVISGIIHVLQRGCRWRAAPAVYGPYKTLYNRFVRWAGKGVWDGVCARRSAAGGPPVALLLDSTPVKAHRSAAGGKGGPDHQAIGRSRGGRTTKLPAAVDAAGRPRRLNVHPGPRGDAPVATARVAALPPQRCLAATAYASAALRAWLWRRGCQPVLPTNPTPKRKHPFDPVAYQERTVIERTFGRLKDWRRGATRYDKLAQNYRATVLLAAILLYWL
ncbi:MAG: IS5 family transposase [Desulfurellaceae bacterium]|nr:IS5 family transposase [Desulfurellaceae bacterium]